MKKECPSEQSLSTFLDGAVSDEHLHQIRGHLNDCATCRDTLAQLEMGDDMIRSLPGMTATPDFNRDFWQKIDRIELAHSQSLWGMRWLAHWKPILAAGLTIGIVAGVALWQATPPVPSVQEVVIAESIEILDELELIQNLDLFENWEALQIIEAQG